MLYARGMDKELQAYYLDIKKRIENGEERVLLRQMHSQRVREFQHERQIHLYVTLFFGGLVLTFGAALLWSMTLGITLLSTLIGVLALLVFVTELFYILYYYRLENGVQRLYELTKKLYE